MKRAFLVLWLLSLVGCDELLGGMIAEGGNCPSAQFSRSYDLTVACSGDVPHQARVHFDGDVSVHLEGKAISGDLDLFSFSVGRTCPGGETVPSAVVVEFFFNADEQGQATVVSEAESEAYDRAYCVFSSADEPEQTVTCTRGGSTRDAGCQATLTRVP